MSTPPPRPLGALLVLALLSASAPLAAQEEPPAPEARTSEAPDAPNWTLQVDPLTTALGYVHLQVERALGQKVSVYAGPHLRLFNGLLAEPTDDYLGLGVELGVRFFPWGEAPAGPWVLARGVGAWATTDAGGQRVSQPAGYVSALGGYTLILGGRWVLSGGAGVQYIAYEIEGMGTMGIAPALHTALGVAF